MAENITEIHDLNTAYNDTLISKQEEWFEFIAPFDGNYLIYSQGDVDTIVELYNASIAVVDGQYYDINEDNEYDCNFLIASGNLSEGAKIYIKVKGFGSSSGAFNIVISPFETVSSIGAFDGLFCYATGGWYKFIVPSTGYYTFYSTSNSDMFGELFALPTTDADYSNRLAYNDDYGDEMDFKIEYSVMLYEDEEIYLRVRGWNYNQIGGHVITIIKTPTPLTTSGQNVNISEIDYVQLAFTAPTSGYYTFYTDGTGSYSLLNAFASPVTDRNSVYGALEIYNHIIFGETNLVCYVDSGQTIYLRVKFDNIRVSGNVNVYYATCPLITKDVEIDGTIPADGTQIYMFIAPEDAVYTINLYSGQESAIWVYNVHPDSYEASPIVMESASGSMGASYDVIECYAGEVLFIMIGDGSGGDNEYSLIIEDIPILEGCGEVAGMVGDWGDFWFAFLAEWDCEYYFYVDCDGVIEIYASVYDEGGETLDGDSDSLEMTDGQIVYVRITCPEYEYMDVYVTVQIEE